MTGKINIAIIGAGGIGKRWVKALNKAEDINLLVVVDKNKEKAEQIAAEYKKGGCEIAADHLEILKRDDLEAVIIATPHKYLAPIARDFLSFGKHILSEKPCGISVEEVEELLKLSKEKNWRDK